MTCYKKYIANKTHEQVLDVIDRVLTEKITMLEASKELNMPESEFRELYDEVMSKLLFA